ncbi:hypothetical protein N7471_012889 [Penicillium samsonianum]|uniref:uncharacterized protein n=1 Tax=Penicillium samsonianum TaxID=1882272 RepID=UPI002546F329|nr:uncharacterized protein N7471_012889 [Penicillium samsonianum]KAJ6125572.1 hypothetical protein N7471_012889 [Penicillium samsonianum]
MEEEQVRMPWSQQPYTYSCTPGEILCYSNTFTAPVKTSAFRSAANTSLPNLWPLVGSDLDDVVSVDNTAINKEDLDSSDTSLYSNFRPSPGSNILGVPEQSDSPGNMVQSLNEDLSAKKARRRAQSRRAQKAFRQRKQEYIETLEKQVEFLEQQLQACRQETYCLRGLTSNALISDA